MKIHPSILLITKFEQIKKDWLLDSRALFLGGRNKGPIDLVGNSAHSLFGVLDSEYADQMSRTVDQVRDNEANLLKLLKNQISVLDATINIMKHYVSLTYVAAHPDDVNGFKSTKIQSSLADVLTDTHHRRINPLLLSPQQVKAEIIKTKTHLRAGLQLSAEQWDLYKIVTVRRILTKGYAIFTIKLPLVNRTRSNQHHVLPQKIDTATYSKFTPRSILSKEYRTTDFMYTNRRSRFPMP